MNKPSIRLTSRNYDDIKSDIRVSIPALAPTWTNHGEDEYGMALLDIVAGVGDGIHFYIDRQLLENFLKTATLRHSVTRLAHMLHYRPKRWYAATGSVEVLVETPLTQTLNIPALSRLETQSGLAITVLDSLSLPVGHTGSHTLPAIQGELMETIHTATGQSPFNLYLPNDQVAEQFFEVRTADGLWYDAFEHPLDSKLTRLYYTEEDDRGRYYLSFKASRGVVPTESTLITLRYLRTAAVNFSSGTLKPLTTLDPVTLTASDFTGASQPETIEEIRSRAPANTYTGNRAVSAEDYEALASRVPGVKSVRAVRDRFGVRRVDVYVAGETPAEPTAAVLRDLRDYLLVRNDITVDVRTLPRTMKDFHLSLNLTPLTTHLAANVLMNVEEALRNALSYDNLGFGRQLRLGDIYHIIEAVDGVDYSSITALHWDGDPPLPNSLIPEAGDYPNLSTLNIRLT